MVGVCLLGLLGLLGLFVGVVRFNTLKKSSPTLANTVRNTLINNPNNPHNPPLPPLPFFRTTDLAAQYLLDFTHPGVQAYIKHVFSTLKVSKKRTVLLELLEQMNSTCKAKKMFLGLYLHS